MNNLLSGKMRSIRDPACNRVLCTTAGRSLGVPHHTPATSTVYRGNSFVRYGGPHSSRIGSSPARWSSPRFSAAHLSYDSPEPSSQSRTVEEEAAPTVSDAPAQDPVDSAPSATATVKVVATYVEGQAESMSRQDLLNSGGPRVLKVNQDLLLFRCRKLRHKAFYVVDRNERARMMQEVEEGLRRAIDMDPTDGRAYVSLGKHYLQQRRYKDAAKVYEDGCAATQGQNPFIWQAWATLEGRRRNINKARKYYDAAIVACSSHVTAWHGWGQMEKKQSLGVLAAEMGRIDEARDWFDRGTRELKGISAHALWQAWALMETEYGDDATVRYLWQRGLKANPKSRYIYLSWGTWECSKGQRGRARKILQKGSEVNPRDPALYQALGVLEEQEGNIELARSYLKSGLEVDSNHIYLWQAYGVLEWRQGNLDEARDIFQKGIWADPTSANVSTIFQAWGCLEAEGGNVALARNLHKCAVKADPNNEVCWMSWAQLEESRGNYQRADDIRNFSMQERVEVITPQLTSRDLQVGWERAPEPEGIGAGSIGQVRLSPERIPPFNADRPAFSVVLPLSGFVLGPSWVGQVAFCAPSPPL